MKRFAFALLALLLCAAGAAQAHGPRVFFAAPFGTRSVTFVTPTNRAFLAPGFGGYGLGYGAGFHSFGTFGAGYGGYGGGAAFQNFDGTTTTVLPNGTRLTRDLFGNLIAVH